MTADPYQTLGVAKQATQDEIKDAYRRLAKKLHPDLNPGNKDAEHKFKEVNDAYERIGSPEARAKHDRGEEDAAAAFGGARERAGPSYRETQNGGGRYSYSFGSGGVDDDLLRDLFGQMGGRGAGFEQDVQYRMEVDFRDAILGAEREVTLPGGKRLRVRIPPGVDTGAKLRFQGQGSPGARGTPPGDAYVELEVKPSSLFKRVGNDVELELPISIAESILGAEIRVPTLDSSILLKIPSGASTGQKLRVAGKGVPNAGRRGDLLVVIKIIAPKSADEEIKKALEAWTRRQPFDPRAAWHGSQGEAA